jgi:cobaltochelatase CobS
MTGRYGQDHPLIPDSDPTFIWTDAAKDVAEAIEHNERVFLSGPSGTGKSSLVRQIAAAVRRPVRRVSLNGETSVADFIGHWTVNASKETVFAKGILPQAMQEGVTIFSGNLLARGRILSVVVGMANGAPGMGRKELNHGSVAGAVRGCVDRTDP